MLRTRWAKLVVCAIVVATMICGCTDEGSAPVSPAENPPVVVRGWSSYMISFDVQNATTTFTDSLEWDPAVAFYSLAVSRVLNGSGTLELCDSSGARILRDSISVSVWSVNRRIQRPMPLRLLVSLSGFTGTFTCAIVWGPANINGLVVYFRLRDSSGVSRTVFDSNEQIMCDYSLVNFTGIPQPWWTGDTRPSARFMFFRGDSLVRDRFQGIGFLATPVFGILAPGDSLNMSWIAVTPQNPLPIGEYEAVAEPQTMFDVGLPAEHRIRFSIK